MDQTVYSYTPIVFITSTLLPLRFVNPSSLNLFNNSIRGGIPGEGSQGASLAQAPTQSA